MNFALRSFSAFFVILLGLAAATPAQAHGGVELILLAGLVGIALAILGFVVGVAVTYFIILKCSRYFSHKYGSKQTSKKSIAVLSVIVFFAVTIITTRILTHDFVMENRARIAAEEEYRISQIGKPKILTQEEAEKLKKLFDAAKRDPSPTGELVDMYLHGNGAPQDFVESYFWMSVYVQQVLPSYRESGNLDVKLNSIKNRITPEQAAAVDLRVAEWLKNNNKDNK